MILDIKLHRRTFRELRLCVFCQRFDGEAVMMHTVSARVLDANGPGNCARPIARRFLVPFLYYFDCVFARVSVSSARPHPPSTTSSTRTMV